MDNIERQIALINSVAKDQRKDVMMTLGKLLKSLKLEEKEELISGLSAKGGSYRGYYSDFAFEPGSTTVEELQAYIEGEVIGKTFTGYKGGDYVMDENTTVWCAGYGSCGKPIVACKNIGGVFHIILGDDED